MTKQIKTAFTQMFDIRFPIVSAPMFLISNPKMLIAAGNAGAMGAMPSLNARTTENFEDMIREIKEGTKSAYGINMIVLGNDRLEADTEILIKHKVPLVITSLGNPSETIQKVHSYGGKVFCDVINLKHALKAKAAGADGLVVVAHGAGGHAGTISAQVLVPWLAQKTGLPVLSSGGISLGTQIHSALALGAQAAYLGTRFIATQESPADEAYKQMILSAEPEDIILTPKVTGHDCNFLKSSLEHFESSDEGLKRWKDVWSAGQGVGLIEDIPTIQELVDRLVAEFVQSVDRIKNTIII